MNGVRHQLTMRGSVASKLIGHEAPRRPALPLEKSTKKADCSPSISPCLDQDIQDLAMLIHRSIQITLLSLDPDKHFIEKPLIATRPGSFTQPNGVDWAKSSAPAPDRLIRYVNSTLGQKILDVAIT